MRHQNLSSAARGVGGRSARHVDAASAAVAVPELIDRNLHNAITFPRRVLQRVQQRARCVAANAAAAAAVAVTVAAAVAVTVAPATATTAAP